MARSRPALQNAVNEILIRNSTDGKRMSYRQAERLTGLSPATIGELAKGNARTPETIRRFALGFGEDVTRLLLLSGFVPEDLPDLPQVPPSSAAPAEEEQEAELDEEEREALERFRRALAKLPPGHARTLWKARLQQDAELLDMYLDLLTAGPA